MRHKTFELLQSKADAGDAGSFTALAAVFGNVDLVGDRMLPGSFTKTLNEWRKTGDPIPVILSHNWDDPMMNIGGANPAEVRETSDGLEVKGRLDVERNPIAAQVHHLLKERRLKGWSFGYTVPSGGETRDSKGVNDISEVTLIEVGPTLKGANPKAETMAVKALVDSIAVPDLANLKGHADVGPHAREKLRGLIAYYMKKPHPFTACVRDNTKRFGTEGAKRVCATLKDIGAGTTHWRHGGAHKSDAYLGDEGERDFCQELYDAADGNVDGLMEMLHEHMARNGDTTAEPEAAGAEKGLMTPNEARAQRNLPPRRQRRPEKRVPLAQRKPQDSLRRESERLAFSILADDGDAEGKYSPGQPRDANGQWSSDPLGGVSLDSGISGTTYTTFEGDVAAERPPAPPGFNAADAPQPVRTFRGTSYWATFTDARGFAEARGLPTDRINQFSAGWAIQRERSGRYWDTSTDSWKSLTSPPRVEDAPVEDRASGKPRADDPLRRKGDELALSVMTRVVEGYEPPPLSEATDSQEPVEEPELEVRELRQRSSELEMNTLIGDTPHE